LSKQKKKEGKKRAAEERRRSNRTAFDFLICKEPALLSANPPPRPTFLAEDFEEYLERASRNEGLQLRATVSCTPAKSATCRKSGRGEASRSENGIS
jgi:hypothetical protein